MVMKDKLPSSIHNETSIDKMNKRAFMSTLVAAGFSVGSAISLSSDSVAAAERDEVPIVVGHRTIVKVRNNCSLLV
ncbi:hypothetical protein [Natrialba magadii]|uniref:hypothetical protein n=1 Tax=Natrialba magadii TaxID=13769 RepID=UPI0011D12D5B|nr:hypothetical protein [Natrialba magadii]